MKNEELDNMDVRLDDDSLDKNDDSIPLVVFPTLREFDNVDPQILLDVYKKLCSMHFTAGIDTNLFARILASGVMNNKPKMNINAMVGEASKCTNKSCDALTARFRRLIKTAFNSGKVEICFMENFGLPIQDTVDTLGKFYQAFILAYRFKNPMLSRSDIR